jgi:hypothetical protein
MDLDNLRTVIEEAVSVSVREIRLPGIVNATIRKADISSEEVQEVAAQLQLHGHGEIRISAQVELFLHVSNTELLSSVECTAFHIRSNADGDDLQAVARSDKDRAIAWARGVEPIKQAALQSMRRDVRTIAGDQAEDSYTFHYISRAQQEFFPVSEFYRVKADADSFTAALINLGVARPEYSLNGSQFEELRPFPPDLFWSETSHYVLEFPKDEQKPAIVLPESSRRLAYHVANDATVQMLRRYSQLAAMVLLASELVGPYVDRIATFVGYPPCLVQVIAARLYEAKIWESAEVRCESWFDPQMGDVAFALDLMVAEGKLIRTWSDENKEYEFSEPDVSTVSHLAV